MMGWRLLLTRPLEECQQAAALLSAQGVYSHSLPLLAIEPLPETPEQRTLMMNLDLYHAVLVISKPAARLGLELLDRYWPQPIWGQPWFAVGSATAQILQDYGLDAFYPELEADSEGLLAHPLLTKALAQPTPRVLLIKGEGGRALLAETLRAQGVQVDELVLYRRVLPEYAPDKLLQCIQAEKLNGIVVSSGQGLLSLRDLAASAWPYLNPLTLFVPSTRVADMAKHMGLGNVVDCQGAGTSALLTALQNTPLPLTT